MIQVDISRTFDIESLLQPIETDRSGGDPKAYIRDLRTRFNELRNPPRSANPDDPDHDGSAGNIDWPAITKLASETLQNSTKDLRIACHLTEAALYQWGLAGFRDGLRLTRLMVDQYWDELAPELDPDDPDARCSPIENLLDDPIHGPRLPTALRSLPLLQLGKHSLSLDSAMRQKDDESQVSVDNAIRNLSTQQAKRLSDDLDETIAELDSFQHAMIERMSEYSPSFPRLQESLDLVRLWFDSALKTQLNSEQIQPATESETQIDSDTSEKIINPCATTNSEALVGDSQHLRAQAYSQLSDAANILQQLEPHSPIPYMIHRAVQMGQMPFPKLMANFVLEESTLKMFSRELGLPSIDANTSMNNESL